jgi:hypothetical protein
MNKAFTNLHYIDRLGASVSFVCAVHCAVTPFAVTILPLVGLSFLTNALVERVVLAVSLLLATASVCWGVRFHKQRRILMIFGAALFLILMGRTLVEGPLETLFVVLGASLFVCSHCINRYFCRRCGVCTPQAKHGAG